MAKRTIWTTLSHITFGIITIWSGGFALLFFAVFIFYELDEDWHISDGAWIDIRQYAVGLVIGLIAKYLYSMALLPIL